MPRDDWARAKSRDIGRRVLREQWQAEVMNRSKRPRKAKPACDARLEVMAGTQCEVRKAATIWNPYVTTRRSVFESYRKAGKFFVFQRGEFYLRVFKSKVKRVKEATPKRQHR